MTTRARTVPKKRALSGTSTEYSRHVWHRGPGDWVWEVGYITSLPDDSPVAKGTESSKTKAFARVREAIRIDLARRSEPTVQVTKEWLEA